MESDCPVLSLLSQYEDAESSNNNDSGSKLLTQDSGSKLLTQDSRSKLLTQDSGSKLLTQDSGSKLLTQDSGSKLLTQDSGLKQSSEDSRLKPSIQDSGSKLLTQDSRSKLLTQDSGSKLLTQDSGLKQSSEDSRLKPSIQDSGSKLLTQDSRSKLLTQDSRSKLLTQDSGSKSLTQDSGLKPLIQYSGSKPLTEDNELNHTSNNAECKRSKHSLMKKNRRTLSKSGSKKHNNEIKLKDCKRVENTFEFHTSCFCLNNKGDKGTTDSEITNKFIFKDNTTLFANKNRFSTCPTNQVTLNNNQENESDEDLSSPPYYDERVSPPTSPVYPRRDIFGNFLNTHKSKRINDQILNENQNAFNQDNSLFNTNNSLNNEEIVTEQHPIQLNNIATISSSSSSPISDNTSTQSNNTNSYNNNTIETLINEINLIEPDSNNNTSLNNENISETLINETNFIESEINNNNESISQSIIDDSFNSTFIFENNETNDNTQPIILNNPVTPLHNQHNNDILSDNNMINNINTPTIYNTPNSNTNNQIVSPSTSLIITPPRLSPLDSRIINSSSSSHNSNNNHSIIPPLPRSSILDILNYYQISPIQNPNNNNLLSTNINNHRRRISFDSSTSDNDSSTDSDFTPIIPSNTTNNPILQIEPINSTNNNDIDIDNQNENNNEENNSNIPIVIRFENCEACIKLRNGEQIIEENERDIQGNNKYEYYNIGKMNHVCIHCEALHFEAEKTNFYITKNSTYKKYINLINDSRIQFEYYEGDHDYIITRNSNYTMCCNNGKVKVESPINLPNELLNQLKSQTPNNKLFRNEIRRYNNAFAFASMSCSNVVTRMNGPGPYFYRVHGNVYHSMSDLYPSDNSPPSFNQIYIYDEEEALHIRNGNSMFSELSSDLLLSIDSMIRNNNKIYESFKTLHEQVTESRRINNTTYSQVNLKLQFKISNYDDRRRFNAPTTTNEIAMIIPKQNDEGLPNINLSCYPRRRRRNNSNNEIENENENNNENISEQQITNLSYNNPFCDPLIYPLMFPYGLPLWSLESTSNIIRNSELHLNRQNNNNNNRNISNSTNNNNNENEIIEEVENELNNRNNYRINNNHTENNDSNGDDSKSMRIIPIFRNRSERGFPLDILGNEFYTIPTISLREFYSYLLYTRHPNHKNYLLLFEKLLLQFMVDAATKIEYSRLLFIANNQTKLRSEKYSVFRDTVNEMIRNGFSDEYIRSRMGKAVIIPSSFVGGPRYMKNSYLETMAIVRAYGKPDLFITMTCNPNWPEILESLEEGQQPWMRPDIVDRVFYIKLKILTHLITNFKVFGEVKCLCYSIEYQKRGMPHAHILITLENEYKLRTPEDIDSYICAEIPDPIKNPRLYEIITSMNMHGPHTRTSQCMKEINGQQYCSKKFPKEYRNETTINEDGYPNYRRRDNGRVYVIGRQSNVNNTLDNRWVVPYNPYLSLRIGCHINVEVCSSVRSPKYIFKYAFKGHDSINAEIEREDNTNNNTNNNNPNNSNRNEIEIPNEMKSYLKGRYLSAPEAMWRIYGFPIKYCNVSVITLDIHDENDRTVYYVEGDEERALDRIMNQDTMLTAYFKMNDLYINEESRGTMDEPSILTYIEFPKYYTYDSKLKKWNHRRRNNKVIGRLPYIDPTNDNLFCLRILLLHVSRPLSFDDLKCYEGQIYNTYRESCIARGLLVDDTEYYDILANEVIDATPWQLRQLFGLLCSYYPITDPLSIWNTYRNDMIDDFFHQYINEYISIDRQDAYVLDSEDNEVNRIIEEYCIPRALNHIRSVIDTNKHNGGYQSTNLPQFDNNTNMIDYESEGINFEEDHRIAERNISLLNEGQRRVYESIMESVNNNEPHRNNMFFIDGPGGTGKTFLYNTIIKSIRNNIDDVIAVAWTGIAATLLCGGKTSHSQFGLPFELNESSSSSISRGSPRAEQIKKCKIIIWDEAPMASKYALKVVDRLLRFLYNDEIDIPFAGKTIVLGGDFRQCLPVVAHGKEADIVPLCIKYLDIWNEFNQFQLTENMRANANEIEFKEFLLKIGNGERCNNELRLLSKDKVHIPRECICDENIGEEIFHEFINDSNTDILGSRRRSGA
ncbi:hypothetical protein WA158_000549 [Blastocystis sp. Blastoise]